MFKHFEPNKIFLVTSKAPRYVLYLLVIVLTIGLIESLLLSPEDYLQSHTVRIMYVHVPAAWLALGIFSSITFLSITGYIFKLKNFFLIAKSLAPSGFIFNIIALVTGSIWGKPTWGTWWVWDARLTSELVLFFIYLGHIFISNAYEDKRKGDRYAAILALLGIVNLPVIKWSVDWWNTLHQPASISKFSSPSIDSAMLFPLFVMTFAFLFLSLSIIIIRIKTEILQRKIDILNSAKIN